MRKVIGIGETVTDIIIRNGVPQQMVCGGSTLNSMVTLGRCGLCPSFVSEVGNDRLGQQTKSFLADNGVDSTYVLMAQDKKSKLSLAFLDANNDADYTFYQDAKPDTFPKKLPNICRNDVVVYGSYYALNPAFHSSLSTYLHMAKEAGALIYYDVNFRPTYLPQLHSLQAHIDDNLSLASMVRGSDEDFRNIFGTDSATEIYSKVHAKCGVLVITRGTKGVDVITPSLMAHYDVAKVDVVSTIGAGDTFNAGVALSIIAQGISESQLATLPQSSWDKIIQTATQLSAEVCGSTDNYISKATGQSLRLCK